ncbi:carboxyl transferase domain-containing protein [Paraferrimonas sedimenticola]|uniref:acetyl-CoA carboxylase n=1 Tax=Paraferrimonas sedimenticola TaxID=375674 RepID=A0AA37VXN1_9GAMM|nr:carboxyl transferase domain-containing protein [Paraferrimonas sedimenticola]GLP96639.1 pyruvate carboxylase [Paraferrimonas sedimenticola]
MTAFRKILIANRGEIAIRIADACAELGITSIAVYAEDDADSLHTMRADKALLLKGRGVSAYLDQQQLVELAKAEGCQAVHPGYGFLSESAEFSERLANNQLVFIGSAPELLAQLGDKAQARQMAELAGLPLTQGINRACSLEEVEAFFDSLGEHGAIMIKALSGGGGRGMRAVRDRDAIAKAYHTCQEEAQLAFGRNQVYVEQLVENARHIEVQILGDGSGKVSHLWERECSLQRRNQKLIEIAPSPSLNQDQRQGIIDSALALASSIKYAGVGTFEFMVDAREPANYYFMEINPRIQVEHTITEEITGVDLVKSQIQLAAGQSLNQLRLAETPPFSGCAIQLRINLETLTPEGATRPVAGVITQYHKPNGRDVRVDDYLYAGYSVNPNYDSLGAKLIVKGADYSQTLAKAQRRLSELSVQGVETNQTLLTNLLDSQDLANNQITTAYVEQHLEHLLLPIAASGRTPKLDCVNGGASQSERWDSESWNAELGEILNSPIAGSLISVEVEQGQTIKAGQLLAVVEAMKMEFPIEAPSAGIISRVAPVSTGDMLLEGQPLFAFVADAQDIAADSPIEQQQEPAVRPLLAQLQQRLEAISDDGRPEAVAKRAKHNKNTIRQNIAQLIDADSFNEYGALALAAQRQRHDIETLQQLSPADGMVVGTASINAELVGKQYSQVAIAGYDYTVMAGSQGMINHKKTDRIIEIAQKHQLPLVLFCGGGGGRPSDTDYPGVGFLNLRTFAELGKLSGRVPTVAITADYCFAGNAALFGCCDLTIATRDTSIGMAGPAMIEGGGLGQFTPDQVGPATMHAKTGVVDLLVENESQAVAMAKRYLSYFQGPIESWQAAEQSQLRTSVPINRKSVYDMRQLIETLVDQDSVLELRAQFAPSAITALVRIEGKAYGLMANDPRHLGGAIDADAGDKFTRFMQLCSSHHLPLISLCDTPGFMVGPESEKNATVRHISRMFVKAANLQVPIACVVIRKAYGLGAMAMAAGGFCEPSMSMAWPSGEFGAMGIEGAVKISRKRQLAAIEDSAERQQQFDAWVAQAHQNGQAMNVASYLEIDAVIDPADTRAWLVRTFDSAKTDDTSDQNFPIDPW